MEKMKMKKITAILVFILICAMSALPVMAADALPANMVTLPTAPKATIVIDGVRDAGYGEFYDENKLRNDATVGATGRFCTAWDDNNVYYYIEVKDTTPNHESANAWDRDCVEFFIDWNSARATDRMADTDNPYWQVRIASAPDSNGEQITVGDNTSTIPGSNTSGDVGIPYKVVPLVAGDTDLKQGYIIEAALPIKFAPGAKPLKEGGSVIVDVQICDNQEDAGRTSQAFLVPDDADTDAQSSNPSACRGILPLGAALPAPTTAAPDTTAAAPADTAAPAPDVAAAPATAAAAAPVATAAQTGDNTLAVAGIMVLAVLGAVIFRKKLFVK